MKTKRIVSLLLALVLAMALLPTTALAVTPVNKITITMTRPSAGKALPTDAKVTTASTYVTNVAWSPADAAMQYDTDYTLTLTVEMKPEKNNTFSTGTINTTINGLSTGVNVTRVSDTVVTVTCNYKHSSGKSSSTQKQDDSIVSTVSLSMPEPGTGDHPKYSDVTVPETASTVVTNTEWYGLTKSGTFFSGTNAKAGAKVTVRIKDGLDKTFADKVNVTVNGKSNKAMVISTSNDRKEAVIFVDFDFQRVIAVNQGRGARTYKIGDPIVAGPTNAEYTTIIHENVTNRSIPESPDGTIQPYSWLITEMDIHIKDESRNALVSVATVLKNQGKVVRYNEFGGLGFVGDIRYETPFRAHITYYQWFGNGENEQVTHEMLDWIYEHKDASTASNYTVTGTAKLQDFLAPRLHSEDKTIRTEDGFKYAGFDKRAYMWGAPTMSMARDASYKSSISNGKVALLTDSIQVIDEHAERMFSGVVGQWYMVKAKDLYGDVRVGFIPAAYVEGAGGAAQPATPGTPAAPAVVLTKQNLTVNGAAKNTEIYNIDGSNYFKLRDMAALLNGTGSQFSVDFDSARSTIVVKTGAAYTAVGGELSTGEDKSSTAAASAQSIEIDGKKADLAAYNIGGNNFFKLRDLGTALNFDVDYDGATSTMIVKSK